MVNGGRVDGWTGVCFSRNVDASRFCNELIGMCKEKGMVSHAYIYLTSISQTVDSFLLFFILMCVPIFCYYSGI